MRLASVPCGVLTFSLQNSSNTPAVILRLLQNCCSSVVNLQHRGLNCMPGEQYVRVGQVAEALGLSSYQVRKYADAGVIKSVVIEGQRLRPRCGTRRCH